MKKPRYNGRPDAVCDKYLGQFDKYDLYFNAEELLYIARYGNEVDDEFYDDPNAIKKWVGKRGLDEESNVLLIAWQTHTGQGCPSISPNATKKVA